VCVQCLAELGRAYTQGIGGDYHRGAPSLGFCEGSQFAGAGDGGGCVRVWEPSISAAGVCCVKHGGASLDRKIRSQRPGGMHSVRGV
jgi:hypothetical protein